MPTKKNKAEKAAGPAILLSAEGVRVALGGISRAKFYRMIQYGEFPQACTYLGDLPRWQHSAVEVWVSERVSARAAG